MEKWVDERQRLDVGITISKVIDDYKKTAYINCLWSNPLVSKATCRDVFKSSSIRINKISFSVVLHRVLALYISFVGLESVLCYLFSFQLLLSFC